MNEPDMVDARPLGGDDGPDLVACPSRRYGPWEQFVSLLTEGLVARGVDVTLFATRDSVTTARLSGVAPTGYSEDPSMDAKVWEARHIAAVFERAAEFDLIASANLLRRRPAAILLVPAG